jgi:hypothetical protein
VIAAFGAGCGLAVLTFGAMRFDFSSSGRRHLPEIPINRADACGKVETIHAALDSLNTSYTAAMFGLDAAQWSSILNGVDAGTGPPPSSSLQQPPWPTVAAGVDASAAQLDLVLVDGIPHFPPRVQRELTAIRTNIAQGRAVLPKVTNAGALNLTRTAFEHGQLHAGYASDLVGDQCPVPLGA